MTIAPEGFSDGGSSSRFRLPARDWSMLRERHPNILVSGPAGATNAFILALMPHLQAPVRGGLARDALATLPPHGGTLILREVDALDGEQQQKLLHWLDDAQNSQTQVISITATPLYAQVQSGTFLDRLYYSLNVIHFDVTPE